MPSRQERRKAERDAVKRAPAGAGAGGAGGAAAAAAARARVNVNPGGAGAAGSGGAAAARACINVNPGGDGTTKAEYPDMVFDGIEDVKQKANEAGAYTRPLLSPT